MLRVKVMVPRSVGVGESDGGGFGVDDCLCFFGPRLTVRARASKGEEEADCYVDRTSAARRASHSAAGLD